MNKANNRISSLGTVRTFLRLGTCSETLCNVLDGAYDHPLPLEEHAAQPLAGGLMQGYQCGQLWGAALAAGAQAYQLLGPGPRAETAAVMAAQRIVESFRERNKEINCLELTGIDLKSAKMLTFRAFLKVFFEGRLFRCFSMSARCAQVSNRAINATLSEKPVEAAPGPVSCAAMLAQKLGASDLHQVMAAGFAGGIGLSGGACGVLGAAIWIKAMEKGVEDFPFGSDLSSDLVDRFVESADYEFECEKIVGRRFADASDHASYLRGGGCAKIIEAMA
jgi:hypothetical protein